MKITVELSDPELREICLITGEKKKGPAIRKLLADALMLKRRAALSEKFISGEWSIDLEGYQAGQVKDQESARAREKRWRA